MSRIDINLIKPQIKKESDKFSWGLYKCLKKNKNYSKVFFSTWNPMNGSKVELDWDNLNISNIIIGFGDAEKRRVSGERLRNIVSGTTMEYCFDYTPREFIDITDEFWERYQKIGRCLLFPHHKKFWLQGEKNRYTYVNGTRKCNWCGKWQKKHIEKKTAIERLEVWE